MEKRGKIFMVCHILAWYMLGVSISCFCSFVPFLREISFFNDFISLPALFAIVCGYAGGLLRLIRMENK